MGKLRRVLSIGITVMLVLVAVVALTPQPAAADHKGPSEWVGTVVGHLPALPLAAVVGGPFYLANGNKVVFNDVGNSVTRAVSWLVSRPEHMVLGVVEGLNMIANGEGCHTCPLGDHGPPPSL